MPTALSKAGAQHLVLTAVLIDPSFKDMDCNQKDTHISGNTEPEEGKCYLNCRHWVTEMLKELDAHSTHLWPLW